MKFFVKFMKSRGIGGIKDHTRISTPGLRASRVVAMAGENKRACSI